jgi:hypothetical protein
MTVHRFRPVTTKDGRSSHIFLKNIETGKGVTLQVTGDDDGRTVALRHLDVKNAAVIFHDLNRTYIIQL